MTYFKNFLISTVLCLIYLNSVVANEAIWESVDTDINAGLKSGYITYQIGGLISDGELLGKAHFPISELKFPRNFKTVQFTVSIKGRNNWDLLFEVETNLSKDAGLLEDRDWLTPDQLDIYSDSKTSVSAKEFLLGVSKELKPIQLSNNFSLWGNQFGFGILGQFYNYRAFDTIQSYPSRDQPTDYIKGDTITFKFSQLTPFVSYSISHLVFNRLKLDARFIFSPFLFAKDQDHHILRDKSSQSNTQGWLFDSSLNMHWSMNHMFDFYVQVSYQYFEASGNQTQTNENEFGDNELQVRVKHLGQQTNLKVGLNFQY